MVGRSRSCTSSFRLEGVIRELARSRTAEVFERLMDIVRAGEDERSVVAACTAILDRGWGKPAQSLEVDARHQWSGEEVVIGTSANPVVPERRQLEDKGG